MRHLKIQLLAGLAACCGALSACTSTGTEASFAMAAVDDPVLPETMSVVPSFNRGDGNEADAMRSLAMEQAADVEFATASYAGPTPQGQLATTAAEAETVLAAMPAPQPAVPSEPSGRPEIDRLIAKYAVLYEVPEALVRSVVRRESTFNPSAYNNGHWGLMQIKHATARGMGYDGPAKGLLDAETNLKYAVKYLRGAYMVARGDQRLADRMYQRGYYYDAKRAGLLDETGLGRDRVRKRGS